MQLGPAQLHFWEQNEQHVWPGTIGGTRLLCSLKGENNFPLKQTWLVDSI